MKAVLFSFLFAISSFAGAVAQPNIPERAPLDIATRSEAHEAIAKALKYLEAAQNTEGAWEAFGKSHPAITALAVKCLAQSPEYGPNHPSVKRGVAYIMKHVQSDGGIYVAGEGMRNYHTSVAIMALASLKDPKYQPVIQRAVAYLKKLQWDEGEGYEASNNWYGGQGYGHGKRPDLSNTQLMLEALHDSGLSADDPAYRKAIHFISRCQNLGSTNDQPYAEGRTDGGFIYSPANDGESKAGTNTVDGRPRLRSYGSMTYAGFKSLLYAKIDRKDERVQKAVDWIRRNYTLDHNPNMPTKLSKQGLYYYYHVFARAMQAWGEDTIVDHEQQPHQWRSDLCRKLIALQGSDGSWVNDEDRWYEGNPHLVTAYAVLALQTALSTGA